MARNGQVDIPLDVIDLILGILHSDGDKSSLSACSRVCHEFLHPCRRHLFSKLIYYALPYGGEFSPFSAFLQDSTDIRPYIRQLSLHGEILDVAELLIILELLPSLQDLTLRRVSPYYRNDALPKALCYPRHLKTLSLENVVECCGEFTPPMDGLDTGSIISMFPDVGNIMLNNVNFDPDDIMVDRQCIRDFRANVERSLHSLGLKSRINPQEISISGLLFLKSSFRFVFELRLPSLLIILDISPHDMLFPGTLKNQFDFSTARFLRRICFVGYVYPHHGFVGYIWKSFEDLIFALPRKFTKEVTFHIHYPKYSLDLMTTTLRCLSEEDWGRIQESLNEMERLTRMVLFFSYHWENIPLDQVDELIKLDQRWEGVVKEKLPGLHQRGRLRFQSSIKHHIHRFKR